MGINGATITAVQSYVKLVIRCVNVVGNFLYTPGPLELHCNLILQLGYIVIKQCYVTLITLHELYCATKWCCELTCEVQSALSAMTVFAANKWTNRVCCNGSETLNIEHW
jgi:hypothetical protein